MLIGRTVAHARFGDGVIVGIDGRYMTVCFASGKRRFVYPDAFSGYLVTDDPDAAEAIRQALLSAQIARELRESRRLRERECLSDKGIVISGHRRELEPMESDSEFDA